MFTMGRKFPPGYPAAKSLSPPLRPLPLCPLAPRISCRASSSGPADNLKVLLLLQAGSLQGVAEGGLTTSLAGSGAALYVRSRGHVQLGAAIMLEAVVSVLVQVLIEVIGYLTGAVLIRGLTLGKLAIGDYGRRPFSVYWRESGRTVLNGDLAVLIGWAFWLALAICAVLLLKQGTSPAQ